MFKDRKAFRDIIDLMLLSERHRDFYIKDLERLIFPAMETGRMILFYNDVGVAEGLYSHTFLTPEAQDGYLTGNRKLQPSDWRTGPEDGKLWIIDFIAPYGNVPKLGRKIQDHLTSMYYSDICVDASWRRSLKGGHIHRIQGTPKEKV